MTLLGAVTCLGPVLEDNDLLAASLAQDLGGDAGAVDDRLADNGRLAVSNEQDAAEVDRVTRRSGQLVDLELGAQFDAILLAAGFDDCVHVSPSARVATCGMDGG